MIFEDIPKNDARSNEGDTLDDSDFVPNEEHFSSESEFEGEDFDERQRNVLPNEPEMQKETGLIEHQEVIHKN